jgi:hypothetical protein
MWLAARSGNEVETTSTTLSGRSSMRIVGKVAPVILFALVVGACATRGPLTDVPHGTYQLVEPEPDVYTAVTIADRAYAVRVGQDIVRGQHWVDNQGRVHIVDDAGRCAGQASIWTYSYSNNRVTINLVEDRCPDRTPAFPQRMVYERR